MLGEDKGITQPARTRKLPPLCPPFRFSTVDVCTHVQVLLAHSTASAVDTPTNSSFADNTTLHDDQSSNNVISLEGNDKATSNNTSATSGAVKLQRRRKSDGYDGLEHRTHAGDTGRRPHVGAIVNVQTTGAGGTRARTQHIESGGIGVPVSVIGRIAQLKIECNSEEDYQQQQQQRQQGRNHISPNIATQENNRNDNNTSADDDEYNDDDEDEDDDGEEDEELPMDNTIKYDIYLRTQRINRHATNSNTIDTNTNIDNARAAVSRSSPLSVHRGAYPTLHNFRFLRRLNLKSLVSLLPKPTSTTDLVDFCASEGITHHCFPTTRNSDVVLVSSGVAAKVVQLLLEPANLPCYVHCVDGRHATGLVMMALRAVQQWSPTSIITEYARFVKDAKLTEEETMFVAVFSSPIRLPPVVPAWLWRGALPAKIHDKENGDVGTRAGASSAAGLDLIFPTVRSSNGY